MNTTPLEMRAGQTGLIEFTEITGYSGGIPVLVGAVLVNGRAVDMDTDGDAAKLTIPPLPAGIWIYEVRADGATVLYGRIRVMESPLAESAGSVVWQGTLEKKPQGLVASPLELKEGPRGVPGLSAYELWLENGNTGGMQEFLASLKGEKGDTGPAPDAGAVLNAAAALLTATSTVDTPTPNSNTGARSFILPGSYAPAGKLRSATVICRNSGTTGISSAPIYLLAQQETANGTWRTLGYSTNAILQQPGSVDTWTFDALPVEAGRRLGFVAKADTSGTNASMGLRVLVDAGSEAVTVDAGGARKEGQLAGCTVSLEVTAAMPLTAQQYTDLQTLLERKSEILALLEG